MPSFSVPSPCPQPWASMTPTAAGRFCGSCQHEVVDFSAMSEAEVQMAFRQAVSRCGRFRAGQTMYSGTTSRAGRLWAGWLAAAAVTLSSCESPPTPTAIHLRSAPLMTVATAFTVRGRVVDQETGHPLAGAHITALCDSTLRATTDEAGRFALQLPAALRDSLLLVTATTPDTRPYLRQRRPAQPLMQVRLRGVPDIIGQYELESHELPPIVHFAPPPPLPRFSTQSGAPTSSPEAD